MNYDTVKNLKFRNKEDELDYKEHIKPLWLKLQKYNLWKIVKDSIKVSSVNSRESRNNYIKLITKDKVMSYRYNNFKNLEKEQRTLIKVISEYLSEVWNYFETDSD